jgi:diazepam-binding inhibitor (GABA receptor modulating acyl-CoA-binding protein)
LNEIESKVRCFSQFSMNPGQGESGKAALALPCHPHSMPSEADSSSLRQQFEQSAERVKSLSFEPSNQEKLQLYSLYKQANCGDNSGSRPGMFEPKGRAKWDAWTSVKGMSDEEAMRKYIALVDELFARS